MMTPMTSVQQHFLSGKGTGCSVRSFILGVVGFPCVLIGIQTGTTTVGSCLAPTTTADPGVCYRPRPAVLASNSTADGNVHQSLYEKALNSFTPHSRRPHTTRVSVHGRAGEPVRAGEPGMLAVRGAGRRRAVCSCGRKPGGKGTRCLIPPAGSSSRGGTKPQVRTGPPGGCRWAGAIGVVGLGRPLTWPVGGTQGQPAQSPGRPAARREMQPQPRSSGRSRGPGSSCQPADGTGL